MKMWNLVKEQTHKQIGVNGEVGSGEGPDGKRIQKS